MSTTDKRAKRISAQRITLGLKEQKDSCHKFRLVLWMREMGRTRGS